MTRWPDDTTETPVPFAIRMTGAPAGPSVNSGVAVGPVAVFENATVTSGLPLASVPDESVKSPFFPVAVRAIS